MNIVNMTPHPLTLVSDNDTTTIPPSGIVPRVSQTRETVGSVAGVPLCRVTTGEVTDLPDPVDGTLLVVSALVRLALPHRTDLASPGQLVRDNDGNVVGCCSLDVN